MTKKRKGKARKAAAAKRPIRTRKSRKNWLATAVPISILLLVLGLGSVWAFIADGGSITSSALLGWAVFSESGSLNTSGQAGAAPVGQYTGGVISGYFGNLDVFATLQVDLLEPINNGVYNTSNVNFVFNVTSTEGIYNCSLFVDGAYAGVNSSVTPGVASTIEASGLSEAVHAWNVTCYSSTLIDSSTTWNVNVSLQAQRIDFSNGTEAANTFFARDWVYINVSAYSPDESNVTFGIYNSSGAVNVTTFYTPVRSVNFTGLNPNMAYYYSAEITDGSGNQNTTGTRSITLDNTAPAVNFSDGTAADASYFARSWIYINLTASDAYENNVTFNLYNSTGGLVNSTTFGAGNRSVNFTGRSQGLYYYNATVYDKAGLVNSTSTRSVVLDTTNPGISLSSTGNENDNSYVNRAWVFVNISVSETYEANMTFNLYNSSGLVNSTTLGAGNRSVNFTSLNQNMVYWYNASMFDAAGNQNSTVTRTITLDSTTPQIAFSTTGNDADGTLATRNWIYINVTAADTNELNLTFRIYNLSGVVNTTTLGAGNRSINFTGLGASNVVYWYNVTIADRAGNSNYTATRNITLDSSPVTISFVNATTTSNGSYAQSFINANVTASSSYLTSITVFLHNSSGSIINSSTSATSPLFVNFTGLNGGTYYLNASANDSRNISGATEKRQITLGGSITISLEAPTNLSGVPSNSTFVYFNVSHVNPISNCRLIVNGQVNQTNTSIVLDQRLSFSLTNLAITSYNWSINCTDSTAITSSSETRRFDVVDLTGFSGNTTNVSLLGNLSTILNFTLEIPPYAKIVYKDPIDVSGGSNVRGAVTLSQNLVNVNTLVEPRLNRNATISLSGLTYSFMPVLFRNSVLCSNCDINSYSGGILSFNVTSFSNYTSSANAQLSIWDDTDSAPKEEGETIYFYANYSNTTSNVSINDSSVYCNIGFPDTGTSNMTFNSATGRYEYFRSYAVAGSYQFNVTCNGTALGYELQYLTDTVSVSPDVYGPRNNSNVYFTRVRANITDAYPEILNISCNSNTAITLTAGSTQKVVCRVLARDWKGGNWINYTNATLFAIANTSSDADDNNSHYTNGSCTRNNTDGYNTTFDCAFDLWYYANNGTWVINATVVNGFPYVTSATATTSIYPLYALNVTEIIDFGQMYVGETSTSPVQANITNFGNMPINVSVYGFGGDSFATGTGLSMICEQRNLSINAERHSFDPLELWANMRAMTSSAVQLPGLTMLQQQDDTAQVVNATYWKLYVNESSNPYGVCNGTVVFSAVAIS